MNAQDILKYGHRTVGMVIDGLDEALWHVEGVCGVWSVKDIIGHLAAYEHVLQEALTSVLDGGETPYLDAMHQGPMVFNDEQAASRYTWPVAQVLDEYNTAQANTMTLVARIPAETLREVGTIPWYGAEYALDDLIVYQYYGHKREHSAQIDKYRDGLRRG